jgi:hypothetical protein
VLSRHDALHFNGISKFVDASVFMLIDSPTRIDSNFVDVYEVIYASVLSSVIYASLFDDASVFMLLYLMMMIKPKRRELLKLDCSGTS